MVTLRLAVQLGEPPISAVFSENPIECFGRSKAHQWSCDGRDCFWGVWLRENALLIGTVGTHLHHDDELEIGYWFASSGCFTLLVSADAKETKLSRQTVCRMQEESGRTEAAIVAWEGRKPLRRWQRCSPGGATTAVRVARSMLTRNGSFKGNRIASLLAAYGPSTSIRFNAAITGPRR
jgi:hypothetical protein